MDESRGRFDEAVPMEVLPVLKSWQSPAAKAAE